MLHRFLSFVLVVPVLLLLACGRTQQRLNPDDTRDASSGFNLALLPQTEAGDGLQLELQSTELENGDLLLHILADDVRDLRALFYELSYDPDQYSPVSAQLLSNMAATSDLLSLSDFSREGIVQHGAVIRRSAPPASFSGSRELATLLFRAEPFNLTRKTSKAPRSPLSQASLNLDVAAQSLSWGFASQGDYDQNGEVNVADLAPLGTFFQESTDGNGPFPAGSRFFMIDGDRNGELNIADLSPIGTNFQRKAASYNIYRSLEASDIPTGEEASTIEPLGFINLADSVSESVGSQRRFEFILPALNSGWFYWVRPCELAGGNGAEGIPSNVVSTGGKPGNAEPQAAITADPLTGNVPLSVQFDASGSSDSDGTIIQFAWDFDGDGLVDSTTTVPQVQAIYNAAGSFTARVQVTDDGAASGSAQIGIIVDSIDNQPPTAALQLDPAAGTTPLQVTLDASASTDDGGVSSFEWDFDGDGSFDATTGTDPTALNIYEQAGNFSPVVRVSDASGLTDTATASLSLDQGLLPPVAVLQGQTEFETSLQFFSAENSSDADGTIISYLWDLDADDLIDGDTGDSPFININVPPGLHVLKLIVTDNDGLQSTTSITLRVRNTGSEHMPPFASFTVEPLQAESGVNRTLDASASTVGDGEDGTLEFHWDFDGDINIDEISADPLTGHVYSGSGLHTTRLTVRQNNSDGTQDETTVIERIPVGSSNIVPLAKLTASPRIGTDPHTVQFDASGSIDFDGTIEKFEWDLDNDFVIDIDGGDNPLLEHVFSSSGSRTVLVTVTDNDGQTGFASVTVETDDPDNPPPAAVLVVSPESGSGPRDVTFNASASTDDELIVSYQFDFDGDGVTDLSTEEPLVTIENLNINGSHTARVIVVDDDGGTGFASDSYTITGGIERGVIESGFFPGDSVSARVNGSGPASVANLIYYNFSTGKAHFASTTDASGSQWGFPSTAFVQSGMRNRLSLRNVFLAPATSVTRNGSVLFARALDSAGQDWGEPVTVASRGNLFSAVLTTASVNPAILFIDQGPTPDEIRFMRSTSTTGATWPATEITAAVADSGFDDLSDLQALFVNGRPAVFYTHDSEFDNLRFVRATAADGSSWGTPVEIPNSRHDDGYSVAIIDGRPAVSVGGFFEAPRFIRASDADGTSWGSSVLVDPDSGHLERSVLAEIDNRPHVFWVDRSGRYRMAVGTSSSGSSFIDTQVIGFGRAFDTPQALLSFDNRAMVIVVDRDGSITSLTGQ